MFKNMNFGLNFSYINLYSRITTLGQDIKKGNRTPLIPKSTDDLCFNDAGFQP